MKHALVMIVFGLALLNSGTALADSDLAVLGVAFTKAPDGTMTVKVNLDLPEDPSSTDYDADVDLLIVRGGQEYSLASMNVAVSRDSGNNCPDCASSCNDHSCKSLVNGKLVAGRCAMLGTCPGGSQCCICSVTTAIVFSGLIFQANDDLKTEIVPLGGLVDPITTNNLLTVPVPTL